MRSFDMKDPDVIFDLSLVFYGLFSISDLESTSFFNRITDEYTFNFSGQDIERIMSALEWALKHKDYDFSKILPNLSFSNDQIITFMERYLDRLRSAFDENTLKAMKVPLDQRELKILIVDDRKHEHVELKFLHTTYKIITVYTIAQGLTKYSKEKFDVVLLSRNRSPNDNLVFLTRLQEIINQTKHSQVPVLALLDAENDVSAEKLFELGCSGHLSSPVPRYLLLQEIYRLTA